MRSFMRRNNNQSNPHDEGQWCDVRRARNSDVDCVGVQNE